MPARTNIPKKTPAPKAAAPKKQTGAPFRMMMADADIHFVEYERREWEGYTLIEGFPGMGLVGTISAKFLTEMGTFTAFQSFRIQSDPNVSNQLIIKST